MDSYDRFSSLAPFTFDLSVFDVFASLTRGATLVLASDTVRKDARGLVQFLVERRITVCMATPTQLRLLVRFGGVMEPIATDLRIVFYAGEVFPVGQLRRLTELLPGPRYVNAYGPTEATVFATAYEIPLPIAADVADIPIGAALRNHAAAVLDDGGAPTPVGEPGFLYLSGPSVTSGYWSAPDVTARAFRERDGARWYNTGDVVIELGGARGYSYVGRKDRQIKRRGFRMSLTEIEAALATASGVEQAVVIAVPADDDQPRVVAFFVATPGSRTSIVELKRHCHAAMPEYMIPDVFTELDAFPSTASDKVDAQALIRLASKPPFDPLA